MRYDTFFDPMRMVEITTASLTCPSCGKPIQYCVAQDPALKSDMKYMMARADGSIREASYMREEISRLRNHNQYLEQDLRTVKGNRTWNMIGSILYNFFIPPHIRNQKTWY